MWVKEYWLPTEKGVLCLEETYNVKYIDIQYFTNENTLTSYEMYLKPFD